MLGFLGHILGRKDLLADFLTELMEAREQWNNILNVPKEKKKKLPIMSSMVNKNILQKES